MQKALCEKLSKVPKIQALLGNIDDDRFVQDGKLTPFALDKILKSGKASYGNRLKHLCENAGETTQFATKSATMKQVFDHEESEKLSDKFKKKYPEAFTTIEKRIESYKASHPDQFEDVVVLDNAASQDEDGFHAASHVDIGNADEKTCALGYNTCSQLLKEVDRADFPTKTVKRHKDPNAWKEIREEMALQVLDELGIKEEQDIFNPTVYKDDYQYRVNWRACAKQGVDESMLDELVVSYLEGL